MFETVTRLENSTKYLKKALSLLKDGKKMYLEKTLEALPCFLIHYIEYLKLLSYQQNFKELTFVFRKEYFNTFLSQHLELIPNDILQSITEGLFNEVTDFKDLLYKEVTVKELDSHSINLDRIINTEEILNKLDIFRRYFHFDKKTTSI